MGKVCAFLGILLIGVPCEIHAQSGIIEASRFATRGADARFDSPANSTTTTAETIHRRILHTGKLLGYMRYQFGEASRCRGDSYVVNALDHAGLTNGPDEEAPKEITDFLCKIAELKTPGTVLVGVGDNFAPFLLARSQMPLPTLTPAGISSPPTPTPARVPNSRNAEISKIEKPDDPGVMRFLERNAYQGLPDGRQKFYTWIATNLYDDSVAAFLESAGYDAVVPGKEDFYFGAYRLYRVGQRLEEVGNGLDSGRSPFERLVPGGPRSETLRGVRILADNLVLRPQEKGSKERRPVPDSHRNLTENKDGVSAEFSGLALPWIKSLGFKFAGGLGDVDKVTGALCRASPNPDQVSKDPSDCENWLREEPRCSQKALDKPHTCKGTEVTFVRNDQTDPQHRTFDPRQALAGDYYFCIEGYEAPRGDNKGKAQKRKVEKDDPPYCMRLPVAEAMFSRPYVLVPDETGDPNMGTAIFGVVEEDLRSNIAQENAGWELREKDPCGGHTKSPCRVEIKVLPADEALRQSLDRFRRDHPNFAGITVLLAEMSQPGAEELARHVPFPRPPLPDPAAPLQRSLRAFDVVIARSDSAHATPNLFLQVRSHSGNTPQKTEDAPAIERRPFAVVPRAIYDEDIKELVSPLGVIDVQWEADLTSFCVTIPGDRDEVSCDKAETHGADFPLVAQLKRTPPSDPRRTPGKKICDPAEFPRAQAWGYLARTLCDLNANRPAPNRCLNFAATAENQGDFDDRFRRFTLCVMAGGTARGAARKNNYSDVAMLQARDFYFGDRHDGSDLATVGVTMQGILDRILWKGDLGTTLILTGKQIKAVLKDSEHYQTEEKSATAISPDTRERYTVQLGVLVMADGADGKPAYFTHLDELQDDSLVKVATSEHIAMGDTGYATFSQPAVGKQVTFSSNHGEKISSLVCHALQDIGPKEDPGNPESPRYDCDRKIPVNSYRLTPTDTSVLIQDDRPYKGTLSRWSEWLTGSLHDTRPYAKAPQEKVVEDYPLTEFVLEKAAAGYKLSEPLVSTTVLRKFAGVTNTDVNQATSNNLDLDLKFRVLRRFSAQNLGTDLGGEISTEFSRQYQESIGNPADTSWPRNNLVFGPVIQFRGFRLFKYSVGNKYRPHLLFVLRPVQWGTQIVDTSTLLSGANGSTAAFKQIRSKSLAEKAGVRYEKDTDTYWEMGYQYRYDYDTLFLVTLNPGASTETKCNLDAELSLANCAQPVVLNGTPHADYKSFRQTGMYWDGQISFPLQDKITYQVDGHGDLFKDRGQIRSNSALTRFYVVGGTSLKIKLIGNFSLKPRLYWTYYENQVQRNHLNRFATTVQFDYSFTRDSRVKLFDAMGYKAGDHSGSE